MAEQFLYLFGSTPFFCEVLFPGYKLLVLVVVMVVYSKSVCVYHSGWQPRENLTAAAALDRGSTALQVTPSHNYLVKRPTALVHAPLIKSSISPCQPIAVQEHKNAVRD